MKAVFKSFERHVEEILDLVERVASALSRAEIEYRLVGGAAVYLHVNAVDPEAARLTRDVDIAVRRADLARVADAVRAEGLDLRHVAGVDLLVDTRKPESKRRVHFVFVREKVRPEYVQSTPDFSPPVRSEEGLLLAPVADLVRMKLTSFRLKDQVHIQDMDSVGLITAEVEARLSQVLRERLAQVRASR